MRRFIEKLRAFPLALVLVILAATGIAVAQSPTPTLNVGSLPFHGVSAATTNATSVSTARGILTGIYILNTNAATAFIKFSDVNVAPTCGTTPVVRTYPLVQNAQVTDATLSNTGLIFNNGIGYCITAVITDADTTAATTGIAVNLNYQNRPGQ